MIVLSPIGLKSLGKMMNENDASSAQSIGSGDFLSSRKIWQVDVDEAPFEGENDEEIWERDEVFDPFAHETRKFDSLANSNISFGYGDLEEVLPVPAGVESIMNQAIADQAGAAFDNYSQLLYQNEEADEDGMMEMDAELGPREDPKLFKDLPNFNPEASTSRSKRRRNRNVGHF